jgi:hypothetical protein
MSTELQAVVVFFDNSLSSLNGDFPPTRLIAQTDTIEVLARLYLDGNPESVFGYSVLAGCAFRAPARPEADQQTPLHRPARGCRISRDGIDLDLIVFGDDRVDDTPKPAET